MKLTCSACAMQIDGPDLQLPKIVNLPGVSIVVIEHPQEFPCPTCGAILVHGVSAVGSVGMVGIPIPPDQQKSLIIPANGLELVKN